MQGLRGRGAQAKGHAELVPHEQHSLCGASGLWV